MKNSFVENLKNKYIQIPWRKMAGFRDVLIQDYNRFFCEAIWFTSKEELPGLKVQLLQIPEDEQ
jgi:uncharacterized protein with HEPN domain